MQFPIDGKFQADRPRPFVNSCVLTDRWRLLNGKELYDMTRDPVQERDIAAASPEVVKELRARYERWWADVSEGVRQPVAVPLGTPAENPTKLNCFEWHTEKWMARQHEVRDLRPANGYWEVEIPRAGRYEFTLRQQPEEAPCPIAGAEARIRIAGVERRQPILDGAMTVTFELDLPAVRAQLQTWLAEDRGAYYVYARRL
jgi:hypothetical protein